MEQQETKRLPLALLYGLLGLLFVWALAYILPSSRDVTNVVFRPARTVATPFLAAWPDGKLWFVARDLDRRSVPPLRRGDRVVSVDGKPFRADWEIARRVEAVGSGGTLHVVVARRTPAGADEEIASTVTLRSAAEGEGSFALRSLAAVVGLLMPWVCVLVGFWVAMVRPRDPLAWLVLFMLLGFQVAAFQQQWYGRWPDALMTALRDAARS